MTITPGTTTLLEKAAFDNGFDQDLGSVGAWLGYGSTHAPLKVWLTAGDEGRLSVALSRADVARGLSDHASPSPWQRPAGAVAVLDVQNIPDLNRLLRRAYQLARTLPHELLRVFEQKTALMPRTTEAERLVVQRVGQGLFRAGLMEYWEGRCAITGLAVPELLRASHIKPWASCEADAERLDVFNGLLLAPHLDAAFDCGFISVADDGVVLVSHALPSDAKAVLGLDDDLRVTRLTSSHLEYLPWHREKVFKDRL